VAAPLLLLPLLLQLHCPHSMSHQQLLMLAQLFAAAPVLASLCCTLSPGPARTAPCA
jgi:hypothetical protein